MEDVQIRQLANWLLLNKPITTVPDISPNLRASLIAVASTDRSEVLKKARHVHSICCFVNSLKLGATIDGTTMVCCHDDKLEWQLRRDYASTDPILVGIVQRRDIQRIRRTFQDDDVDAVDEFWRNSLNDKERECLSAILGDPPETLTDPLDCLLLRFLTGLRFAEHIHHNHYHLMRRYHDFFESLFAGGDDGASAGGAVSGEKTELVRLLQCVVILRHVRLPTSMSLDDDGATAEKDRIVYECVERDLQPVLVMLAYARRPVRALLLLIEALRRFQNEPEEDSVLIGRPHWPVYLVLKLHARKRALERLACHLISRCEQFELHMKHPTTDYDKYLRKSAQAWRLVVKNEPSTLEIAYHAKAKRVFDQWSMRAAVKRCWTSRFDYRGQLFSLSFVVHSFWVFFSCFGFLGHIRLEDDRFKIERHLGCCEPSLDWWSVVWRRIWRYFSSYAFLYFFYSAAYTLFVFFYIQVLLYDNSRFLKMALISQAVFATDDLLAGVFLLKHGFDHSFDMLNLPKLAIFMFFLTSMQITLYQATQVAEYLEKLRLLKLQTAEETSLPTLNEIADEAKVYPINVILFELCMILHFCIFTVRLSRTLYASMHLGPKVHMIRKMAKELLFFSFIILLFWFNFSSLIGSFKADRTDYQNGFLNFLSMAYYLVSEGTFEMFGNPDPDSLTGKQLYGCWNDGGFKQFVFSSESPNYLCGFYVFVTYSLTFCYVLIVQFVIVCLLTAVLSAIYDEARKSRYTRAENVYAGFTQFRQYRTRQVPFFLLSVAFLVQWFSDDLIVSLVSLGVLIVYALVYKWFERSCTIPKLLQYNIGASLPQEAQKLANFERKAAGTALLDLLVSNKLRAELVVGLRQEFRRL